MKYYWEKLKFRDEAKVWLKFKQTQVKESTYLNYKYKVDSKLNKELGNKSLSELIHYDFNLFIAKLMETNSEKTVKDIIVVLKQILGFLEKKHKIDFNLELIGSPKLHHHDIELLQENDRLKLEKYCMKSKELKDIGILISLYGGLRIGEVCALKWKNINLERKIIMVSHTLQRVYLGKNETKIIYTSPKTQNSERVVPIANVLLEKLQKLYQRNHYKVEEFLLTGREDKLFEPVTYRYLYKQVLKKNNIEEKKYHSLRHTFATRCIKIGMDLKSLSEILGHSNVSITLNLYVHPSLETKNKYINKLCL